MKKKQLKKENNNQEEKKKKEDFENFIREKFELIGMNILVPFVKVNISFVYDEKEICAGCPPDMVLSIIYQEQYKQAFVSVYPNAYLMWNMNEKKVLIDGMIHEISHVHTTGIGDMAQNRYITEKEVNMEVEGLTETIAEYIRRLIQATGDKHGVYKIK
jgi:hypothetical protein